MSTRKIMYIIYLHKSIKNTTTVYFLQKNTTYIREIGILHWYISYTMLYICSNRLNIYHGIIYTRQSYIHNDQTILHKYRLYLENIHSCLFTWITVQWVQYCTIHIFNIRKSWYENLVHEIWGENFNCIIFLDEFRCQNFWCNFTMELPASVWILKYMCNKLWWWLDLILLSQKKEESS